MARSPALAIAALLVLAFAGGAQANTLALSHTVPDTDVKYAGFSGMRDIGTGTLTVTGVIGPVTAAYLYWHGPTNSADPASNASVVLGGTPVAGTNIGTSDYNCWGGGFINSQAYFADVTSLVSGNGSYALADFMKSGGDINVNGVSLIVLHNDGNTGNDRDLMIFRGNDSNVANASDAEGWGASLSGVNYTAGTTTLDLHVSDGQGTAGFEDEPLAINGVQIAPFGAIFSGDTVPGHDGTPTSGRLWDIKSFNITNRLSPGPNTLEFTTTFDGLDCLSLIAAVVNIPSHPPPSVTTGVASVSPTNASLSGTVNPNGEASSYRFQYGTTTSYGSQTALRPLPSGTSPISVSATATGLEPSTTYHYRVAASNVGGLNAGPDRTFTTDDSGGVLGNAAQSPAPVARKTVVIAEVSGSVFVKVPGSSKFVPIGLARSIPVGSQIDARKGRVRLTSAADASGKTQSALFYDGIFKVGYATEALSSGKKRKKAKRVLITQATLVGKVGPCPKAKKARTSAKRRKRRLWGNGKGRFRTRGKRSSALVRGTTWLVEDRCDGTLTRVTQGSVTVRDFAKRKNVIVKKGKRYLARGKP